MDLNLSASFRKFVTPLLILGVIAAFAFLYWNQMRLQNTIEQSSRQPGLTGAASPTSGSEKQQEPLTPGVSQPQVLQAGLQVLFDRGENSLTPYLVWDQDAKIYGVEVFSGTGNTLDATVQPVFAIESGSVSLPSEWRIGTLPSGFRVTGGTLTSDFQPNVYYRVAVSGKIADGTEIQDTTYFVFTR